MIFSITSSTNVCFSSVSRSPTAPRFTTRHVSNCSNVARRHNYATCLLIFNIPETVCAERNPGRERKVDDAVMPYHAKLLRQTLLDTPDEGWQQLYVLGEDDMDAVIKVGSN